MNRNDFIKPLHLKLHDDDFSGICSPYPYISVSEDPNLDKSGHLELLFDKTKSTLKELFDIDINREDINHLLEDDNLLKSFYTGNELGFDYHSLYDTLLDKNKIINNDVTQVYRLECKNGEGVYKGLILKNKNNSKIKDFLDSPKRPSPLEDHYLKSIFSLRSIVDEDYQRQWIFGFKDKKELSNWFSDKNIVNLIDNNEGYIAVYEVPDSDLVYGSKQVAFKKEPIRMVKKIKISELKNNQKRKRASKP